MPHTFSPEGKEQLAKMQRFTLKAAMTRLSGGEYREPETALEAVLEEFVERDACCLSEDGLTITFRDEDAPVQPVSLRELLIRYLADGTPIATGRHNGRREPIPAEFWRHKHLHIDWGNSAAGFFTGAPPGDGRVGVLCASPPGSEDNHDDLTDINIAVTDETLLPYVTLYSVILVDYFENDLLKLANDPAPQCAVPPIPRKRGPRAVVFERVTSEMRQKLNSGALTRDALEGMLEKHLRVTFGGASRDVCRCARNTILAESEFVANSQTKGDN